MIFVVCISYWICVLPLTALTVCDPNNTYPYLSLVVYVFYWMQYCCNNIIYVLSNSVFRKAYVIFLADMIPPLERFLVPSQPRQSIVGPIGGSRTQPIRSVLDLPRRPWQNDSPPSQASTSLGSMSQVTDSLTPPSPKDVTRRVGPRRAPPLHGASAGTCHEAIGKATSAKRRPRLAGWRRHLPLERAAGVLAGWWPFDDSGWRRLSDSGRRSSSLLDVRRRQEDAAEDTRAVRQGFCCYNPALNLPEGRTARSNLGAALEQKTLFGRQRSISFWSWPEIVGRWEKLLELACAMKGSGARLSETLTSSKESIRTEWCSCSWTASGSATAPRERVAVRDRLSFMRIPSARCAVDERLPSRWTERHPLAYRLARRSCVQNLPPQGSLLVPLLYLVVCHKHWRKRVGRRRAGTCGMCARHEWGVPAETRPPDVSAC